MGILSEKNVRHAERSESRGGGTNEVEASRINVHAEFPHPCDVLRLRAAHPDRMLALRSA